MSETRICCEEVWNNYTHWPCGKTAKFERDGKWYCGIHDPEKRKERSDEFSRRIVEESLMRRRTAARAAAAVELLELFEKNYSLNIYRDPDLMSAYESIMAKAKEAK